MSKHIKTRLSEALDELIERVAAAEFHTPGGELLEADFEPILAAVARAHRVPALELRARFSVARAKKGARA